jgi:hypothetical protein
MISGSDLIWRQKKSEPEKGFGEFGMKTATQPPSATWLRSLPSGAKLLFWTSH